MCGELWRQHFLNASERLMHRQAWIVAVVGFFPMIASPSTVASSTEASELRRLKYNHPGLVVDLGVGLWAWPLPMDYDQDGDLDLVVSCPDKPYNGTYFFENTQGNVKLPVFRPAKRISRGLRNVQVSYVDGVPRILSPGREYHRFLAAGLDESIGLPVASNFHQLVGKHGKKIRAQQWSYCDFDADGALDIMVGIGDWSDYGWDDAFNAAGQWTQGPLHGFVYLIRNQGTNVEPRYAEPEKLTALGQWIDVYGRPSPNYADFDGDGDFDLLCGEFLDGFTYFENVGNRQAPTFRLGSRLASENGSRLVMDLQMIVPVAIDWDGDGDSDLIVGDEDGRVALVEHTGQVRDGAPVFREPVYFQQQADNVMCGALSTPCGFDWDGDGDDDLLSGNTAGYIVYYENLGRPDDQPNTTPRWAAPVRLTADDEPIRIQAGPNGSIQGPCEAKWGYTTLTAGDWDHDGLPDIVANSIWGRVVWYRNVGTRAQPVLAAARSIAVAWPEQPAKPAWNWWNPARSELVTQWRTTPVIVDFNGDGLNDLVMLDHEGFLALYKRRRHDNHLVLLPPERIFVDRSGAPIRLNDSRAGGSGRRKLAVTDWDGDGRLDLLVNSKNADWFRQIEAADGQHVLEHMGALGKREISSHTTSPTTVDWNRDQIPDLLVGAEDGFFYYLTNSRSTGE